jgi:NADP-dependent 3-hydroxy acid dehydrogenase YdfG
VARSKEPLEYLKSKHPQNVAVLVADLEDLSFGAKAVDTALKNFNRLDGLVVNHGVLAPVKRVADAKAEDWRKAFDINFFSAVALVQIKIVYELNDMLANDCLGPECSSGAAEELRKDHLY